MIKRIFLQRKYLKLKNNLKKLREMQIPPEDGREIAYNIFCKAESIHDEAYNKRYYKIADKCLFLKNKALAIYQEAVFRRSGE